jgi:tetratricopeptide (TPR) repeat protein
MASALMAEDLGAAEAAFERARALGADEQALRQLRSSIDSYRSALLDRQRRAEHDRLAAAAVEASRHDFEGGRTAEAFRRLEAFTPPHPAVTAALDGLRKTADAEERQRQATIAVEEARRRRSVVEKLADARTQLARGAFSDALASISAAVALEPNLAEAAALRREILQSQAEAELDARARKAVDEANTLARAGKFHQAIRLLDDLPPHSLVQQSRNTLKVLAERFERRAGEAIASAQQLFESENEAEAIAALNAFEPAHVKVSEACRALSARLSAIENHAAPTRVKAEEIARQGRLEEAIAVLEAVAPAPPSVRIALRSLREQYTHELRQRAARDRAREESYDRAVEKIRIALSRGDVTECERLLTVLRTDYPKAVDLELLAEEVVRQRRPKPAPPAASTGHESSRLRWMGAAAASVLLVAGAMVAYWLRTPSAPISERLETTTSIPVTTTTVPPVGTGTEPVKPSAPTPPPPPPPPSAPPPGPEVTNPARDLLASGDRSNGLKAIEEGLRNGRTRDAYLAFVDTYLARLESDVRDRAEQARQAGATWAPSFRSAETESRLAQETARSSRTESLQHAWNALDSYSRSHTDPTQALKIVERADDLFQAGNREQALDVLVRPGTDHLRSPDAMALLGAMRGQAEANVQGARKRAADSGASEEIAGFRSAAAVHLNATSLVGEGRMAEGIRALWDAERLFVAAIVPARPPEPPRNRVEVPPVPPAPSGVGDDVLRNVLTRFKQAYDSGRPAQLEQAFPQLKDEAKNYRVQLGACRQVAIDFSDFRVIEREPSAATVRTRTIYRCVPKVGTPLPDVTEDDLFSLAPGPGGTWTITRKWK